MMSTRERSSFEAYLFLECGRNDEVKNKLEDAMFEFQKVAREYNNHEAAFGEKYCDIILKSNGKVLQYKKIAYRTGEPITSYYFYRKVILEKLSKKI